MKRAISLFSAFAALLAGAAYAQEPLPELGIAKPWQLGFQEPASPVAERLFALHDGFLLYTITAITLLVLVMTVFILFRFHHKRNPVPSKVAHNTTLEIIWTVIPVLILVAIAVPSLRIHYFMEREPEGKPLTIKVTGYQWYWHYDYPDNGGFGFDSYMVKDADLKPGQPRLLTVDNPVVVPVDTPVVLQLTAADVIHSWAMPAMGVKKDAVPGRLNQTWFQADKPGIYYGQCSELCGVGHAFMPIALHVLPKDEFDVWVRNQQVAAGIVAAPADAAKPAPAADAAAKKPAPKKPAPPKEDEAVDWEETN